ncbi:MAG: exodeoxyribonuclease VII small subunit [Lachnospiraceae bacterium]|nr:exodeoxyribonuclease VII small subunit [Lachnospiraceae bacterium]
MAKKKLDFEYAISRMEEIVKKLEDEDLSLDKSIEYYKEGMTLAAFCKEKLENAKSEILMLKENINGEAQLEPFFDGEDENEL